MYDRAGGSALPNAGRELLRNQVEPNPDTVEARLCAFDKLLSAAGVAFHERLGEAVRRLESKLEPILSPSPPAGEGATTAATVPAEPANLSVRLDMRLQRLDRFVNGVDRVADYINGMADRVQL